MAQALHLSNGETINDKLRARGGAVERLLADHPDPDALLLQVYLLAFGRAPRAEERERVRAVLARAPLAEGSSARREMLEDLFSALLTTREFLFNH